MIKTDTTEKGLEALIVGYLVEYNGYEQGANSDYNKEFAVDEQRLWRFISSTQPVLFENLNVGNPLERKKILTRLSEELSKNGVIQLLRNGFRYLHYRIELYNSLPNSKNKQATQAYGQNIFSVTRQVTIAESSRTWRSTLWSLSTDYP